MISIKNKKDYQGPGEYVGRPSPLGNPFQIGRDGDRKSVIKKYRTYLVRAIRKEGAIRKEFYRLLNLARNGDLTLICWCAPLACHGDVIKEFIETILASEEKRNKYNYHYSKGFEEGYKEGYEKGHKDGFQDRKDEPEYKRTT